MWQGTGQEVVPPPHPLPRNGPAGCARPGREPPGNRAGAARRGPERPGKRRGSAEWRRHIALQLHGGVTTPTGTRSGRGHPSWTQFFLAEGGVFARPGALPRKAHINSWPEGAAHGETQLRPSPGAADPGRPHHRDTLRPWAPILDPVLSSGVACGTPWARIRSKLVPGNVGVASSYFASSRARVSAYQLFFPLGSAAFC